MEKKELRKLAKREILKLNGGQSGERRADQKKEASLKLSRNIKSFLPFLNSQTDIVKDGLIGGFSPLEDELDWWLDLTDIDLHPCVPSIREDGEMEFHKVGWRLLSKEFLGLTLDKGFPVVRPRVIVVPGLAFSSDGRRLGRGKGYYDRYLAKNEAYKIGVCSQGQIFEEITLEEHDILMDAVITDQNIYRRGNER